MVIWSHGSRKKPIGWFYDKKIDEALGNHKYVIFINMGAFAKHRHTKKQAVLVNYNILWGIFGEQTIHSVKKTVL